MRGKLGVLGVVVVTGLAGCALPGFPTGANQAQPPSQTSSPATAPPTTAPVERVAPPTVATTTTTVAPTTTTIPAPQVPTASAAMYEALSNAGGGVIESVSDVVSGDDGTAAYMAGKYQSSPGEPSQAMVWVTDGRTRARTTSLDQGDADESWANGIAIRGQQILVAGTTRTGARTAGVVWQSDDAGVTYGAPRVIDDGVTALADIAFADKGLVAVGSTQPDGQRSTPIFLSGSDDAWTTTVLGGPDIRAAQSVTANGAVVVVTGTAEVAGETTALMWQSTDAGGSFAPIDSALTYAEVGTVTVHDGTYITSARGKNDDPMMILTSPDGLAWTATEVKLTREGEFYASQYEGGERVVVAPDGSYVTEVGSGFGFVGRIRSSGRGEAIGIFEGRLQANFTLIPFVIGGQVSVVSNTERSFAIFAESDDGWDYAGPVSDRGALARFTTLHQVGERVALMATSYPVVTNEGRQTGSSDFWSSYDDSLDTFQPMTRVELPLNVSGWAGNGQTEVALSAVSDDPADDEYDGSIGGTSAQSRLLPDGEWTEPELILSGPGGDYLEAIDQLGPGYVAVGSRYESGADQISTTTPAILEYLQGKWATAALPDVPGTSVGLYDVVGTSGGSAVAIGFSNDSEVVGPLVLARRTDGTWTRVDLPIRDAGADVISTNYTDDRFELLVEDAGTYAVLTSADGQSFERRELRLEDPFLAKPAGTARVDGTTYVVGVTGYAGARTLALWKLNDDGSLVPFELSGAVPIGDVKVDSVLANGADIWAAGQAGELGMAWRLNVGESGSTPTTAPPGDASDAPATTEAPAPGDATNSTAVVADA